jgi:RCC1 and BTB domain-containing protein
LLYLFIRIKLLSSFLDNLFVKSVVCGQNSTFANTRTGEVYAWGFNGNGQLGVGNTSNQHSPCRVCELQSVIIVQVCMPYNIL